MRAWSLDGRLDTVVCVGCGARVELQLLPDGDEQTPMGTRPAEVVAEALMNSDSLLPFRREHDACVHYALFSGGYTDDRRRLPFRIPIALRSEVDDLVTAVWDLAVASSYAAGMILRDALGRQRTIAVELVPDTAYTSDVEDDIMAWVCPQLETALRPGDVPIALVFAHTARGRRPILAGGLVICTAAGSYIAGILPRWGATVRAGTLPPLDWTPVTSPSSLCDRFVRPPRLD